MIPPNTKTNWLSQPSMLVSAVVHAGAAGLLLLRAHEWPWAVGALAANHAVLTAAGLWPRSRLLGPNWTHLPDASASHGEVAITIDDGPDPTVTPEVLAQLAAHGAHATFFCVGVRVAQYAELAREIVRQGHAIENHSHHHRHNFSLLGPGGMKNEITLAQQSIAQVTGHLPQFFRAPAGLRNPFLEPILSDLDLRLASWTRRGFDTVNRNADQVLGRLTDSLRGGDILLLHDGHAALGQNGRPVILDVLPRLLAIVRDQRLKPVTLREALARSAP